MLHELSKSELLMMEAALTAVKDNCSRPQTLPRAFDICALTLSSTTSRPTDVLTCRRIRLDCCKLVACSCDPCYAEAVILTAMMGTLYHVSYCCRWNDRGSTLNSRRGLRRDKGSNPGCITHGGKNTQSTKNHCHLAARSQQSVDVRSSHPICNACCLVSDAATAVSAPASIVSIPGRAMLPATIPVRREAVPLIAVALFLVTLSPTVPPHIRSPTTVLLLLLSAVGASSSRSLTRRCRPGQLHFFLLLSSRLAGPDPNQGAFKESPLYKKAIKQWWMKGMIKYVSRYKHASFHSARPAAQQGQRALR